ncbi:cytokine receptor common subunit beta-like [Lithobates pipiens]
MRNCIVTMKLLISVYLTMHVGIYACTEEYMPENFSCFSSFASYTSCTWYSNSHPDDGPFLVILDDKKCTLTKMAHDEKKFSCNITDLMPDITDDPFKVEVQNDITKEVLAEIPKFTTTCHIKLDPPVNLSYKINGTIYTLMWNGYEDYYEDANLDYELQLKRHTSTWKEAKQKTFHDKHHLEQSGELLASEFETGSDYDLRLRCKIMETKDYSSQWSEWSSELRILALGVKDEGKVNIVYIIIVVCPLATACILLYLVFCSSLGRRLKIPFLKEVPTAANFFRPLYIVHNGNFQDWTKYPNKCSQKKQEGRYCRSADSVLRVSTILCFQKDTISPIKVEAPAPANEVPVIDEECDVTSWSGLLQNKDISLSELYPSIYPNISLFNEEEEQHVSEVECPTVYFTYNGTYIVNSVEAVD